MSDLLNVQQTEFDEVQIRFNALHEEVLADSRDIMEMIRSVCDVEGEFYTDKISQKINMLMDCIEGEILTSLESNYEAEKTAMETFIASIKAMDQA